MKALRLLLVEDDHDDAFLFRRRCPKHYEIVHVTDAAEALKVLGDGQVDIGFVDYQLGAEDGLELIRRARALGLRIPLILMTGQDIEAIGENALLAGATDFSPKEQLSSENLQRLVRWGMIRQLVDNRRNDTVLGESQLALLLGPPPRATAAAAVRQVVCISQANGSFSPQQLMAMCAAFASVNAKLGLTGALVVWGNCFVHLLEGEPEALAILLDKMAADTRHDRLSILLDVHASRREFPHWNMARFAPDSRWQLTPSAVTSIAAAVATLHETQANARLFAAELFRRLPQLLGASQHQ